MMFMGEYSHSLDPKGRISLPAKFRDAFSTGLVVTKGLEHCLFVFTAADWQQIAEKIAATSLTSRDLRSFARQFLSGAAELETDKQGRILLPANLRSYAELEKDAVIIGVGGRMEIWNSEKWDNYIENVSEEYEAIAEEVLNLGISI